jgi:endonuclease/exonuclease/phosphatase family metal-dependent hydrolase
MYYNILDFPGTTPDRVDTLKKIIQHTQPDVLVVNELQTLFGANLIQASALNTNGITHYAKAAFFDGPDTDNMIFYNTNKLGLSVQFQIVTQLRDISEYKMYYKSQDLGSGGDTTFIWFYSAHLKAGNTANDASQRQSEAQSFKNYLSNNNRTGNMVLGGDFNFYTSSEQGCQTIMYTGNQTFRDPINRLGSWNNNSSFADIHTQSTRTSSGYAGGSTGGLDDRFDIIFLNDPIINGFSRVSFVPGSYIAVGQDGNRFNGTINSGFNAAVPQSVADALFYMSDHLPVVLKLAIDHLVGVPQNNPFIETYRFDAGHQNIQIILKNFIQHGEVRLFDLAGRQISSTSFTGNQLDVALSKLTSGVYLIHIADLSGLSSTLKIVKP